MRLLGSVSWGHGALRFEGRTRRFRICELGVGGVSYAEIRASGDV